MSVLEMCGYFLIYNMSLGYIIATFLPTHFLQDIFARGRGIYARTASTFQNKILDVTCHNHTTFVIVVLLVILNICLKADNFCLYCHIYYLLMQNNWTC